MKADRLFSIPVPSPQSSLALALENFLFRVYDRKQVIGYTNNLEANVYNSIDRVLIYTKYHEIFRDTTIYCWFLR